MKSAAVLILSVSMLAGIALAATPPSLMNYQGVLRDGDDDAQTGNFDMIDSTYKTAEEPRGVTWAVSPMSGFVTQASCSRSPSPAPCW